MKKKKKQVTIHDLAEELNLSASTVSRALKNHNGIGKKTKDIVKKLAKERGYRPNTLAASLRTKQSNTLGLIVPRINRPFISSLISGIENTAQKEGYQIIITQSNDDFELERKNVQTLYNSRISALIVSLAMSTKDYAHFELFTDSNIPIVFVDRIPANGEIEKVHINNFKAAFEATEHLIEQGCKRIAHLGGAGHQQIYEDRKSGYIAALKKNNIDIDASLILEAVGLSAIEGENMANKLLSMENPPDGIFSANDTAAVSTIRVAKKRGIRVPEELAVIGFNNDPICEIIEPALSTVYHPAIEMGVTVVEHILEKIENKEIKPKKNRTILDTYLIIRASSKRKT
jgi:LacI family transcriptional regulator